MSLNVVYNYYFSGNFNLAFSSYRAVEDYLRTLTSTQLVNMFHPYYKWCIVRENKRTGRKVYFEINPLNYSTNYSLKKHKNYGKKLD